MELIKPIQKAFNQVLHRNSDSQYRRHADDYALQFGSPWFLGPDKFEIEASADIPKSSEGEFLTYELAFSVGSGTVSMQKASVIPDTNDEPRDRALNRIYRSLIGILKPEEREALIKEEKAWIAQRDSTQGSKAKKDLVQARIDELQKRMDSKVRELEKQQGKSAFICGSSSRSLRCYFASIRVHSRLVLN